MNNTTIKTEIVSSLTSTIGVTDSAFSKVVKLLSSSFLRNFPNKHNGNEIKITHNYSIVVKSLKDISVASDLFIDYWIEYTRMSLSAEIIYPDMTGYSQETEDTKSNVSYFNLTVSYIRQGK